MKKILAFFLVFASLFANENLLLIKAIDTLDRFMSLNRERIPSKILLQAQAIAIFPNLLQGGFILGARYGEGVLLIKNKKSWSDPIFIKLFGGSLGWQIGFEKVEVILIFPDSKSVFSLLKHKITLGLDLSIAVGPIGNYPSKILHPKIYSYSRSMGVFAGLALAGSVIELDMEANARFYRCEPTKLEKLFKGECNSSGNAIVKLLKQKLQRYTSPLFSSPLIPL